MTHLISGNLIRRVRANQFLRHNLVFFAGSLAVSALNYLYYPVLGRLLPSSEFGEVQALVSLFLQATIFLSVVSNVAVNIVANEPNADLRSRTIAELERLAILIVVAVLLIALVFLPKLQSFLRFDAPMPFIILGLSLVMSVPLSLRSAYLRGVNAFARLSIAGMLSAGFKLVISALLVMIGFGTSGAISGLVLAQAIAFVYARNRASRLGHKTSINQLFKPLDLNLIKPHFAYAGLVLVVSVVTTTQFSFDILVVKHYFAADVAGAYAGIATVARIIYFLTGSVAAVLLANVKRDAPLAENRALLWRSIVLQIGLGGGALAAFAVAPHFIIHILMGPRYLALANLLPELSLALFIIAFINLLLTYDLALRRWSSAVVALVGITATFYCVIVSHQTPAAVVHALLIGSIIMLALRGADAVRRRWQRV